METEEPILPPVEVRESIKIIKNTKGYGWEIRLFVNDTVKQRMEDLDLWCKNNYGGSNE